MLRIGVPVIWIPSGSDMRPAKVPRDSPHGPANPPHCRSASYATIAAQLERLRLRTCGREGIVRSLSALAATRSLGSPRDSLPNTSTAPFL